MHAPGKPKEGAHSPFSGLSGVTENLPITLRNLGTKLQGTQQQEEEPHVTGHPNIRVSSGRVQVHQRLELFPQDGIERLHVIGPAAFPNMSQGQHSTTAAAISTQAGRRLASS